MHIDGNSNQELNLSGFTLASIIAIIVYWIVSAVRSTLLVADIGFFSNLFGLGAGDLVLRGAVIVGIVAAFIYIRRTIKHLSIEKNRHLSELSNLQFLIDAASCPIIEVDSQLCITHANKAAAILTGYKADDLVKQNFITRLFDPEDQGRVKEMLQPSARPKGEQKAVKIRAKRIGACYVDLQTSIELTEGKINRIILFLQDVTDLVTQGEVTQNRVTSLIALLQAYPSPVALLSPGKVEFLNQAAASLMNLSSADLESKDVISALQPHISAETDLNLALEAAWTEQTPSQIPLDLDENQFVLDLRPLGDGADARVMLLVRDETELKTITADNEQLKGLLNQMEEKILELKAGFAEKTEFYQSENEQLLDKYMEEQRKNNALQVEMDNTLIHLNQLQEQLANVEELKQANAKLQHELQTLDSQLKEIELPIVGISPEGIVTQINAAARSLLGLDENMPLESRFNSPDQAENFAAFLANLASGEIAAQTQIEFGTGADHLVMDLHGISQADGHILLYGHNITEYSKAQKELALTVDNNRFALEDLLSQVEVERDRMHAILSNVSEGIIICDMYNRIMKMNPAAEDLLGIRLSQAHERPLQFVIPSDQIIDHIKQTIRQGLLDHQFQVDIVKSGTETPLRLALRTTVVQDRFLHDQGVIIQLKEAPIEVVS